MRRVGVMSPDASSNAVASTACRLVLRSEADDRVAFLERVGRPEHASEVHEISAAPDATHMVDDPLATDRGCLGQRSATHGEIANVK